MTRDLSPRLERSAEANITRLTLKPVTRTRMSWAAFGHLPPGAAVLGVLSHLAIFTRGKWHMRDGLIDRGSLIICIRTVVYLVLSRWSLEGFHYNCGTCCRPTCYRLVQ
ncbi:hypothetical protein F5Y03DRAFT_371835 [Xylaria venustula]|nr:hypothetical protein F5Y03DRAFT_371835 [Xylaria venustula]